MGNDQVAILSQDDKARVPIGITAVNKQAPFLMSVEYKVTLPDHDWVVATRHKLIPSVYAGIKITSDHINGDPSAVSYSRPTFIAIRSGKHSTSNAATHAFDFDLMLDMPQFETILKGKFESIPSALFKNVPFINKIKPFIDNGVVKPVVIFSVDGGPDENPRYPRVIEHAIQHFREHNLDANYIFTNAPGRSAYNRVERRMAPLSRELSGVILPHEHFGSHLDSQCRTTDTELEKKNFQYGGEVLAEVWGGMEIDGFSVTAKYLEPGSEKPCSSTSMAWYAFR